VGVPAASVKRNPPPREMSKTLMLKSVPAGIGSVTELEAP